MMIKAALFLLLVLIVPALMLDMSFMDKFSSTIQMVQYLNSAVKENVEVKNSTKSITANLITNILKLMSFDETKLAAAGVNTLIFLAQLLASSLTKSKLENLDSIKDVDYDKSFTWIIDSFHFNEIMPDLLDPNLPELAVKYTKERSSHTTGCVEMLICKISPFIWTMQKVLKSADFSDTSNKTFDLYSHFPTREELKKRSDECSVSLNSCL